MALVIRPATPADRPALDEQAQLLNLFEEPLAHDRRLDRAGGKIAMNHLHARAAETGGAVLVAQLDGAVVGHMVLTFEKHGVYVREALREHAHIADLFVRAAHRGRGIGQALLARAETMALARGVPRITLGVVAGNNIAERTYRRFGYDTYALEMSKDLPQTKP